MKNKRKQIRVDIQDLYLYDLDGMSLSEAASYFNSVVDKAKEMGLKDAKIDISIWGEYDNKIIGYRQETKAEYDSRLKQEQEKEKRQKDADHEAYMKLKQKFEN